MKLMKKQPSTSYVMKAKASECVNEHAELGGITTGDVANHVLPYASPKEGWWSIDCSLVTTRNSTFTIFLRFLTPAKSATCGDSPSRRILTFWTSAQMRQEGGDQLARYVLACSLRGVFSHSGSLSIPG
jgi:hypothetical protein